MKIDVHHHWMPREHIDNVEKYLRPNERAVREGDKVRLFRNDLEVFTILPAYPDIGEHLRVMDMAGVDMAVLSTCLWQEWNTMAIAPFINDSLAKVQREHPNRIIGLAPILFI